MLRDLVADFVRISLVLYSLLFLALSLFYAGVVYELSEAAAQSIALRGLGFCAFPLLMRVRAPILVTLRGRRRDLRGLAFVAAWALAYGSAGAFFGSTAHDLDMYLDGSHGRFCADDSYFFGAIVLRRLLFGVLPALWWLLCRPRGAVARTGRATRMRTPEANCGQGRDRRRATSTVSTVSAASAASARPPPSSRPPMLQPMASGAAPAPPSIGDRPPASVSASHTKRTKQLPPSVGVPQQ